MTSPSLPHVGEVLADKYRIDGELGSGGMAVVYAAHHVLLDKPIAVKILSPDLPRLPVIIERFLTEARAAARVESPNVARVVDVGVLDGGIPYMVMERLDGCDLAELLRLEKRLSIGDTVDYTLQALQGLASAHVLGIVHRDLKPANSFLAQQQDGNTIIKILDFGIAKLNDAKRITEHGQAVGSPTYMSPEHIRAEEHVDHRTDIWSMGVVMYELLTGQPPIEEDGVGETIAAVLNKKPPPPSAHRPEIPPDLDAAIMRCLEHSAADRWPDVSHLARAIAPYGTGACSPLVDSIEMTLRQELRRYSGQAIMIKPQPSPSAPIAAPVFIDVATITQEAPAVIDLQPPVFEKKRSRWWLALVALVAMGGTYAALVNAHVLALPQSFSAPQADSAMASASASASAVAVTSASVVAPSASSVHHHASSAPHKH